MNSRYWPLWFALLALLLLVACVFGGNDWLSDPNSLLYWWEGISPDELCLLNEPNIPAPSSFLAFAKLWLKPTPDNLVTHFEYMPADPNQPIMVWESWTFQDTYDGRHRIKTTLPAGHLNYWAVRTPSPWFDMRAFAVYAKHYADDPNYRR